MAQSQLLLAFLLSFSVLLLHVGADKEVIAEAPSGFATRNVYATSVQLSWRDGTITCKDTLGGLAGYAFTLNPKKGSCAVDLIVGDTIGQTATCTGLTPNSFYNVTIQSLCTKNLPSGAQDPSSPPSNPLSFRTKPNLPSSASAVSVSSVGNNQVSIEWVQGEFSCTSFLKESFVSWVIYEQSSQTPLSCDSNLDNSASTSSVCTLPNYSIGNIAVQLKCTTLQSKLSYFPFSTKATQSSSPLVSSHKVNFDSALFELTEGSVTCENANSELFGFEYQVQDSISLDLVCNGTADSNQVLCTSLSSSSSFEATFKTICKNSAVDSSSSSALAFSTLANSTLAVTNLSVSLFNRELAITFEESARPCSFYNGLFDLTNPSLSGSFSSDLSFELEGSVLTDCSLTVTDASYRADCAVPLSFVEGKYHTVSVYYRCAVSSLDSVSSFDVPESYASSLDTPLYTLSYDWNTLNLSWSEGSISCSDLKETFEHFQVSWNSSNQQFELTANSTELSAEVTPNTEYTGQVQILCSNGVTSPIASFQFTSLEFPNFAPEWVTAEAENSQVVQVEWMPNAQYPSCSSLHSTFVQWKVVSGYQALFCQETLENSTSTRCFVEPGTSIDLSVSLECEKETSSSTAKSLPTVIPYVSPSSPSLPEVSNVEATSVVVSWNQTGITCEGAGTAFTAWYLSLSSNNNRFTVVGESFDSFSLVAEGLSPNTNYSGTLTQVCQDPAKSSSPVSFSFKTALASVVSPPVSVSSYGSDALAFDKIYDRVFVEVIPGSVSCEFAGSAFQSFDIQGAALNSAGEGMYKSLVCASTLVQNNLYTFRCNVMPGTLYRLRASTRCVAGALSSTYTVAASTFTTLDASQTTIQFSDIVNSPSAFDSQGNVKVMMTTSTFANNEQITGMSFTFVTTASKRSAAVQPDNTTDVGTLEFVLDALTKEGTRPSGYTQGPIVFKFNTTQFGIPDSETSRLKLFFVELENNTWVSAEETCDKALRQNWVQDGVWTVATCHLSQFKAFLSGATIVSSTSTDSTSDSTSDSASETIIQQTNTGNNVIGGSNQVVYNGISTGALIGAIVACIVGVIIIAVIIIVVAYKRHQNKLRKEAEHEDTEEFEPYVPQGGELGKSVSDLMARDAEEAPPVLPKVARLGLESDEDSAWSSDEEDDDHNGARL